MCSEAGLVQGKEISMNSLKLMAALLVAIVLVVFGAQNTQATVLPLPRVQGTLHAHGARSACGSPPGSPSGLDRLSTGALPPHA